MANRIHLVGFARGGTTLLKNLFLCFKDTWVYEGDMYWELFKTWDYKEAPPPPGKHIVTKAPNCRDAVKATQEDPEVKIVVLIRDLRDVVTSKVISQDADRPFMYANPAHCARGQLSKFRDLEGTGFPFLLVRYEDLVSDPEREQERIAEHCGLEIEVPFSEGYSRFPEQKPTNCQHQLNGIRPIDSSSVGRWKRPEWKEYVARFIQDVGVEVKDFMEEQGYESF